MKEQEKQEKADEGTKTRRQPMKEQEKQGKGEEVSKKREESG